MQTELKTEVVLCPNCKEEVPKTLYCLNCGYPLYKMQSEPEEKKESEEVPLTAPEASSEKTVIDEKDDDFSTDNMMDEVEDMGLDPEPVEIEPTPEPTEPTVMEPEPVAPEPTPESLKEPIVEDVRIDVEPTPVISELEPVIHSITEPEPTSIVETKPEPITVVAPTVIEKPTVMESEPTPPTEPEAYVEPEPVYEPEPEPVTIITQPVEPEPETLAEEPEIVEVVTEVPVEEPESVPVEMPIVEPDTVIKELMTNFAKNISMKIKLVNLLQTGEVKKETFHRLFESYLARGESLMNSRNEMLEKVKYELKAYEKSLNEARIGLEELKIKKTIGDVTLGEFNAKAPGFEWDISKYENEVNQKTGEISYLNDIRHIMTEEEINELTQKGEQALTELDNMAMNGTFLPETAGRVRVIIEEALACLNTN
jgi:hypothetical protein